MGSGFPILEFDSDRDAVINPSVVGRRKAAAYHPRCVLTFFRDVLESLERDGTLTKTDERGCETGPLPVYELEHKGSKLTVALCGVGAPLAAALMEEIAARGARLFIVCGGAGVLGEHDMGHVFVPTAAVRDEGTSYHYLPPGRLSYPCPRAVEAIEATLEARDVPHVSCTTWTTDAFYRETRGKVERRKAEGCLTVEMEAAALFAVGRFRGLSVGQILYGGDSLAGDTWDSREWHRATTVREKLFWLAVESCLVAPLPGAEPRSE